jgi:3-oxoacyl-[acyl-carrier-protein] synthase II
VDTAELWLSLQALTGTSTLVGDIAETKAVRSVFSDWSNIKMNATKSMLGHCLGAAAGVEAVATVMAIKRGEVHPTINHEVRSRLLTKPACR